MSVKKGCFVSGSPRLSPSEASGLEKLMINRSTLDPYEVSSRPVVLLAAIGLSPPASNDEAAVFSSHMYVKVPTTSSAVNTVPSDHFTPVRSFQVTLVKSLATPPFATLGISAARPFASAWPFLSQDASGSTTSREASLSFRAVAWGWFRMVGACQYR